MLVCWWKTDKFIGCWFLYGANHSSQDLVMHAMPPSNTRSCDWKTHFLFSLLLRAIKVQLRGILLCWGFGRSTSHWFGDISSFIRRVYLAKVDFAFAGGKPSGPSNGRVETAVGKCTLQWQCRCPGEVETGRQKVAPKSNSGSSRQRRYTRKSW